MSESKVQAKILRYIENELGYYVRKVIVANKKGTLDIFGCTNEGEFFAIEVKYGNNTQSALQQYNIDEIKKRKGIAFIAYSLEDVKEQLG